MRESRPLVRGTSFDHADAKGDPVERLGRALREQHAERISGEIQIPAVLGAYASFPDDLDTRLAAALRGRGIERLYSHQRVAWEHVRGGAHTALVTPTASGKSLCYNLPVLQAAIEARAKALYLFPTKALSQDQVAEIIALNLAGDLNEIGRAHV